MNAVPDTPDILARIEAYKREEIRAARLLEDGNKWRHRAEAGPPPRDFVGALRNAVQRGRPGLIAEIKKASPSKGLIRADFDPPQLAKAYADGGATCLSVLTDAPSFQGSPDYLAAARSAVSLPVLRKDFLYVREQVWQSRVWGADCILVIMTAVDDETARILVDEARDLGMGALLEVHDERDLERALRLDSPLIGINNRDLRTFHTDIGVTERLAAQVPADAILISESGIGSNAEVRRLQAAGAHAFLVGESLMRQEDVAGATRALLGTPLTHLDEAGAAHMVNVGEKAETERYAIAEGVVSMEVATLAAIEAGNIKKGDVIGAARIAGIMAAKRTADIIPLCHPIPLDGVIVDLVPVPTLPGYKITARTSTRGRTGVEMEALTAVSAACLTLYDMAKAVDRGMTIGPIRLLEKAGGRSGTWRAS
ncbi:indole-3-glycerol phosphate synthase TrpC [Acuticoccus kalidii]|uniref:indole-3-glycerol phosphate synthase TrpC n=1 Tax=Acuticoccus kalidii TaxID=2910977 RepID=UPI0034E2EF9B